MRAWPRVPSLLLTVFLALAWSAAAQTKTKAKPATDAEKQKILAALPAKPLVPVKASRKVLVLSVSPAYYHSSIPIGATTFELMGRKTGAFEPVLSDDPKMLAAETIGQFDAIILNNCNREIFRPDAGQKTMGPDEAALRESFAAYIRNGGGIAGTHAVVNMCKSWPEARKIIGAVFVNHPWNGKVSVLVDDPTHPVNQAVFSNPSFEIDDEIYQVGAPYSRDRLRVLLRLDPEALNLKSKAVKRQDRDFALAWVKPYGKGRVFYSAFGHKREIFWNPLILRHWLAGIQFACGDLEADTTPSAARPVK